MTNKKYLSLYTQDNITIWGTYDERHKDAVNEIVITQDGKKIYYTGNNLLVNVETLAKYVEDIILLINSKDIRTNNILDLLFYHNNTLRFCLSVKRIKNVIQTNLEDKKREFINNENKTLLTEINTIAGNKELNVYNFYYALVILKGAKRQFTDKFVNDLYDNNELSKLESMGITYSIFKEDNYNKGCKYMNESENIMYKDILVQLKNVV